MHIQHSYMLVERPVANQNRQADRQPRAPQSMSCDVTHALITTGQAMHTSQLHALNGSMVFAVLVAGTLTQRSAPPNSPCHAIGWPAATPSGHPLLAPLPLPLLAALSVSWPSRAVISGLLSRPQVWLTHQLFAMVLAQHDLPWAAAGR